MLPQIATHVALSRYEQCSPVLRSMCDILIMALLNASADMRRSSWQTVFLQTCLSHRPAMQQQPCLAISDWYQRWLCWVDGSTACQSFAQKVPAEANSLSTAVI